MMGYEFKTYRNIPGDSTSISDNRIESVYIDHLNNLWVGTRIGLDRYLDSCDCFRSYAIDDFDSFDKSTFQPNAFVEDRDSSLWIGIQEGGLFQYDRENDFFIRFLHKDSDPFSVAEEQVRVLMVDSSESIMDWDGRTIWTIY